MPATKPALEQPLQQADASSSALVPVDRAVTGPARSPFSLAEIEDFLTAMVESAEMVSQEQMAEYLSDLGTATDIARQKRDRCAQSIFRFDDMTQLLNARIAHLQERIDQLKQMSLRVSDERSRFEGYLLSLVEKYGETPKKMKNKRLEGAVFALCAETKPDTVKVEDETKIPKAFKRVAVTLHLPVYERLVELGFTQGYDESDMPQGSVSVIKDDVKKALNEGIDIPGADLEYGKPKLVVRARKG